IDAERPCLAAEINRAVVHGVAEILAGVAKDHHPTALHHETGERSGVAADDDGAAFLIDSSARADRPLADQVAAAQRGAELRSGIFFDDNCASHHVLAAGPADAPLDGYVRTIEQAAGKIAARPLNMQVETMQDADRNRMLRSRIAQNDSAETALD